MPEKIFLRGGGKIKRNSSTLKADRNTINIFKDFVQSDCEYLLIFDSDLIIHDNFFQVLSSLINRTQGVLTLYNSFFHDDKNYDNELCIKKDAGFAGLVIRKDLVEAYLNSIEKESQNYKCNAFTDWGLSEFLEYKKIKIFSVIESQIQHIGIFGQHCSIFLNDYSINFNADENENEIIYNALLPLRNCFSQDLIVFLDKIYPLLKFFRCSLPIKEHRMFLKKFIAEYKLIKNFQKKNII